MNFNPFGALDAATLSHETVLRTEAGDDEDSEQRHRQALELKVANFGTDSVNTAFSYNALGEALLRNDKLAEAEEVLIKAIVIREVKGPAFDAAVSRENLACVCEAQGRWAQAKDMRTRNRENMVCSHYKCPGTTFLMDELKKCSLCKATYYCSIKCQVTDWKARHKRFCTPTEV
ncbi:hypothetical protein M407DRAFT_85498 [Tulasnella calospora MUT 4182]|uniref:MYND-type domain-containing protein n=1 Tax=Tulasnella calospora MUT 4182 TaxID=1051891 RepID=A0A0C3K6A8_9AGAM|nr:hypothetical protein M407DRAFT_85498 [Tulasnella calospora MUT 4182]